MGMELTGIGGEIFVVPILQLAFALFAIAAVVAFRRRERRVAMGLAFLAAWALAWLLFWI
jgi:hypothetical protein